MPRRLFPATPSKLASFADCPRRYRYAYVDRPTPPKGPAWAHNTVGAAVHAALRSWWDLPVERRTTGAARQLLYAAWSQNGFRDAEQAERWRAGAAGWLTDYVGTLDPTDEPVGNERTVGATTERLALSGPGRPHRPARRRAGDRRLQDRPGPSTDDEARGSPALAAYVLGARRTLRRPCTAGRAAPPAQRHGGGVRAHRAVAGQPRAAGRGHRHRHHRGHREDGGGGGPRRRLPGGPGRQCSWCDFRPSCPTGQAAVPARETWSFLAEDDSPERSRRRVGGHPLEAAPHDRRAAGPLGQPQHRLPEALERRRRRGVGEPEPGQRVHPPRPPRQQRHRERRQPAPRRLGGVR